MFEDLLHREIHHCVWCGKSLTDENYYHMSMTAIVGGEITNLYFCKPCFHDNDLYIRETEEYDDYLRRVGRHLIGIEKEKPS